MFGGGGGRPPGQGGRTTLADLVRQETAARMSEPEKWAALRGARLYFQRPEDPGFLVSETAEDGPFVPVFTSLEGLARFAGACGWASTTAEDLVGLLPEGVRALVDPLGERPFLLDARTLRDAEGPGTEHPGTEDPGTESPGTESLRAEGLRAEGPGAEHRQARGQEAEDPEERADGGGS
ncbi:SseB family protein [Streptomyces malaysiensis subsp. malaysiensis]|uniref:SseB family protein n=1 Tax=Streptomyces malaysiensis TaxID=92644 RepID=UPI0024BFE29E|nr:SseB family protein [Streptomyces sp. NA07423]WHX21769.1 SseB family protein [Streptomyces sp. NA07423]